MANVDKNALRAGRFITQSEIANRALGRLDGATLMRRTRLRWPTQLPSHRTKFIPSAPESMRFLLDAGISPKTFST